MVYRTDFKPAPVYPTAKEWLHILVKTPCMVSLQDSCVYRISENGADIGALHLPYKPTQLGVI
jgi:hypothetical protein